MTRGDFFFIAMWSRKCHPGEERRGRESRTLTHVRGADTVVLPLSVLRRESALPWEQSLFTVWSPGHVTSGPSRPPPSSPSPGHRRHSPALSRLLPGRETWGSDRPS